jgi:hypothetical protein
MLGTFNWRQSVALPSDQPRPSYACTINGLT